MASRDGTVEANVSQASNTDNRGARYLNVGAVYNAPVNHQKIVVEKSVTYEVDPEDTNLIERFSILLIKHLGEKGSIAAMVVHLAIGGLAFLMHFASEAVAKAGPGTMAAGIVFIAVGVSIGTAMQYRASSRCVKCNTFYAMKEKGNPTVRETPRKGGVQMTTTRTYECKECGAKTVKKTNEFVPDEPEEDD